MENRSKKSRFAFFFIIAKDLFALLFITMAVLSVCVLAAKPESTMERQPVPFELSLLNDGIYRGSYGMAGSEYTVDVTIEAHRIKAIAVISGPERTFAKKCGLCDALAMIKETIETQSLPVDAYSGATQTTSSIKHALEAALKLPFEGSDYAPSHTEAWR
jgi:uncharacterized protein with FMN-binding domain